MRAIKFRGKSTSTGNWVYGLLFNYSYRGEIKTYIQTDEYAIKNGSIYGSEVDPETVGQFTGLADRNEKEIYNGDIIRYRRPYRSSQTHTGDNIPNGSYTEPMEPAIETIETEVVFEYGMFGVVVESNCSDSFIPLQWVTSEYNEDGIRFSIEGTREDIWDEPEEGDLQYLLEEYKCMDVNELLDYVNVFEIIRNIHERPELLNQEK